LLKLISLSSWGCDEGVWRWNAVGKGGEVAAKELFGGEDEDGEMHK
jgi:hypothetical protein